MVYGVLGFIIVFIRKILAIVNTNMFIGLYIACSMVEEIGDLMIITYPKRFVSINDF
jgi:hypothetical protein